MNTKYVVVLGKFDGVHIAHQKLIKTAVQIAKSNNLKSLVLEIAYNLSNCITTLEQREKFIYSLGVDKVICQSLSEDFKTLAPEEFVKNYLIDKLGVSHIVVGYNYRFGVGRSGDVNMLASLCKKYQIGITIIENVSVYDGNENISVNSTYIRKLLEKGDMLKVKLCLGRFYSISGQVFHGKMLGRKLGFHTANIMLDDVVHPKFGVYATRVSIDNNDEKKYLAVTNVGINPTVEDNTKVKAEAHIIDYTGDLYGKEITIEFIEFIRPEVKFKNAKELADRVISDRETVKNKYKIKPKEK